MCAIYSPRLEYISLDENPMEELSNAIECAFKDESMFKCFGYLFETFDRHKLVLIINANVFEMDVIIRDKSVTIIKGAFNDIKMYLVAKISKHLSNVEVPYNAFEYIQRRILTILSTPPVIDFINVTVEIYNINMVIKLLKHNGCTCDALYHLRQNLKRFIGHECMKKELASPLGIGVKLSQYLASTVLTEFSFDISKLYLIHYLLEYPELNELAKSYCRIALLDYYHIDYDNYPDVVYEIAEWIHSKHFKEPFTIKNVIDMEHVD
jgi:hypothetical protein